MTSSKARSRVTVKRPERTPLGQRARQVETVERNDRAVARLDPEDVAGVAAVGHRENAGGIAPEQQPRIEAFAHSSLAHFLLRAAQAHALFGFDQRTLDEDRMFHHRVENIVVADDGSVRPSSRPAVPWPEALARGDSGAAIEALQFLRVGGAFRYSTTVTSAPTLSRFPMSCATFRTADYGRLSLHRSRSLGVSMCHREAR